MKLFDAHCHLQDGAIFPMVGKIMARAADAGIKRFACCGTSSNDWKEVFQLSEQYPQIIPMIGIHPWFVSGRDGSPLSAAALAKAESCPSENRPSRFQTLEKLLRENPGAGIGETGLDFSSFAKATADRQERFTNRAEQEASFAAHLDLAREMNRPVAVHCVQAWGRLIEILREHSAPRILLHAFGGAPELIPELVELNCWFSFCGSVANPQAKRVRASAAAVPSDRLLIETDSPDFPPAGCYSPNEPANLIYVARAVADLRGVSADDIAQITFTNATELFGTI